MDGGCADFVCVPEVNCIPVPDSLDYTGAAAVPVAFVTAWNMLVTQAHLAAGEDVLVMGAGSGVGTAAVQIAKLFGARVIAVAGTDEKLAKATALGADEGINYARQDLAQEIRRLTGKRGVDVVFEHVGGATWQKLIPNIASGGRLVTCGASAGYEGSVDIRYLFSKSISILGTFLGTKADMLTVVGHLARGSLRPVIDRTLPLADCAEGHRLSGRSRGVREGRAVGLKGSWQRSAVSVGECASHYDPSGAVSVTRYRIPQKQKSAPRARAPGAIQKAAARPTRSETTPTRAGEMASPSAWMTKIFTA